MKTQQYNKNRVNSIQSYQIPAIQNIFFKEGITPLPFLGSFIKF